MTDWTKVDWGKVVPLIELYATKIFKQKIWRGEVGGPAPGGNEPPLLILQKRTANPPAIPRVSPTSSANETL